MGAAQRNNPFNQWKRGEAPSQYSVIDCMGREIRTGDTILVRDAGSMVSWRVGEIKPDLTPRPLEPGRPALPLVQIQLVSAVTPIVVGGRPVPELLKVRDASEDGPPAEDAPQRPDGEQIGDPPIEDPPGPHKPSLVITDRSN